MGSRCVVRRGHPAQSQRSKKYLPCIALDFMKLAAKARTAREDLIETLAHTRLLMQLWWWIYTNNAIERLNRGIRRCMQVAGTFPGDK